MYKKKKNRNKEYIFILIPLVLALFIALAFKITSDKRDLNYLEKTIKDGYLYIGKFFNKPINYIKEKNKTNKETKNLLKKYNKLKEKEEQIKLNEAKIEELEKEIMDLKSTLELKSTLSENSSTNATVINRNVGYWYETLTIDKGVKDGIENNTPVIVNAGLVGVVTKVSEHSSTVKLLTGLNDNKISVKIKVGDNYIFGLLSGYNEKNKTFTIEGISENVVIDNDSIVMTTGLGSNFPAGIYIGKVVNVTTDNFDLIKIVEIKSDVNFDDINYVTVLKKEETK